MKKRVLLIAAEGAPYKVQPYGMPDSEVNSPDNIARVVSEYLSPVQEIDSFPHKSNGDSPKDIDLTIRTFNGTQSFIEVLAQDEAFEFDELVIACHGKPLYLATSNYAGLLPNELELSVLDDEETLKELVSVTTGVNPFLLEVLNPDGIYNNFFSVRDIWDIDETTLRRIQSKFRNTQVCHLRACLPFYNLDVEDEEHPVFGVEFARMLGIPVIGSTRELVNLGSPDGGELLEFAYDMVTATPKNGYVNIKTNYVSEIRE